MSVKEYIEKHIPSYKGILPNDPSKVREFCAYYKKYPTALEYFTQKELLNSPDLWFVGTKEAKQVDTWLKEAYPSVKTDTDEITESILVCGKCKERKVDYYQKQTRGADEPMTCFCHCLNCGTRWVQ
tara:strand:- start:17221 stop:17601 length:381 start_codon:yes stop_codon:yes gene_type:complete